MWIIILFIANINYAQSNTAFFDLRERHIESSVVQQFVADLDSRSASLLVGKRVKKPYRVEFVYDVNKGIDLLVKDTDPFYINLLSSYATHINTMLFPLLNTPTYTRLQKRFNITCEDKQYQLSFKKGDVLVNYIFKEGKLGLIDNIQYFENGKKLYVLSLNWQLFDEKYLPISVKSVSYLKTITTRSFKIENILLK